MRAPRAGSDYSIQLRGGYEGTYLTAIQSGTSPVLAVAPEYAVDALYAWQVGTGSAAAGLSMTVQYAFTAVYAVLGIALFVRRRRSANGLVRRTVRNARSALGAGSE